jgi:hypothetical protein
MVAKKEAGVNHFVDNSFFDKIVQLLHNIGVSKKIRLLLKNLTCIIGIC